MQKEKERNELKFGLDLYLIFQKKKAQKSKNIDKEEFELKKEFLSLIFRLRELKNGLDSGENLEQEIKLFFLTFNEMFEKLKRSNEKEALEIISTYFDCISNYLKEMLKHFEERKEEQISICLRELMLEKMMSQVMGRMIDLEEEDQSIQQQLEEIFKKSFVNENKNENSLFWEKLEVKILEKTAHL